MPQPHMTSLKISERHRDMMDEIAAYQGGLTKTRVLEWAVERLHADIQKNRKKNRKSAPIDLDVS